MDAHSDATKRLDQFVDAAFAFAVTLLVIAGASPPESLRELRTALLNIPASATAFVMIAAFWNAHRAFGRMTPVRDGLTVALSLAVVFTVLVYVYPLRLLMQSLFFWISRGALPGQGLIRSWNDLSTLYQIYGLGFAVLSALCAALFARSAKLAPDAETRALAMPYREAWSVCAAAGVLSAAVALLPLRAAPWLPPMTYWLIPPAIWAVAAWRKRLARPTPAAV